MSHLHLRLPLFFFAQPALLRPHHPARTTSLAPRLLVPPDTGDAARQVRGRSTKMTAYRHRPSLRDELDRVTTDEDDAEIFEFLEEIDSLQAAPNERWQSPKTQHRQDYVLKMYLGFLRNWLLRREHQNSPDDVLMTTAFPSDVPKLVHRLQSFMTATFLKARPRSHQSNERIQYRSLAKYRECMLFWVRHVFTGRTEAPYSYIYV
ncbi:hypothetical protein IWZ03DRAFT_417701 [Phyllosticta citriasiana]|uniref:Uncharacterized protein n=2 Tax=Phyllosticta citriasiana TaxID=595635 RepID=A0ABR1KIC4_9PEZI